MPKRKRRVPGSVLAAGAALVLTLSGGPSPAQEAKSAERFLAGMLVKTWTMREQVKEEIQASDKDLEANAAALRKADERMSIATSTSNDHGIYAARGPLDKARAEKKRLKQVRSRLDLAQTRTGASFEAVRNLALSSKTGAVSSVTCGIVSLLSGKAEIIKKSGQKTGLAPNRPAFLEAGDEIVTARGGAVELLALDGRAVVRLGEQSRLKLEEAGSAGQGLRLLQGKIYAEVDAGPGFVEMVRASAGRFESDPGVKEAVAGALASTEEWTDEKLMVRTATACCSVAGAKSAVEITGGETDIAVLEGSAEAGDADCGRLVPLGPGFQIAVRQSGPSQPGKNADVDRWWEKW